MLCTRLGLLCGCKGFSLYAEFTFCLFGALAISSMNPTVYTGHIGETLTIFIYLIGVFAGTKWLSFGHSILYGMYEK